MSTFSAGFEDALDELFSVEGGYSNHPADSGGVTQYGITEQVARRHGYDGPMEDMAVSIAKEIYFEGYWEPLKCEKIMGLHARLAWELFEIGVNMGTETAGRFLQRCLNVLNRGGEAYDDIVEDGIVGPQTLRALSAYLEDRRGEGGKQVLLDMMNSLQAHAYIQLAERRQKDEAFLYGWIKQRVSYEPTSAGQTKST